MTTLNPLKTDGLSVRNIGKPQVAFLFVVLLSDVIIWVICDLDCSFKFLQLMQIARVTFVYYRIEYELDLSHPDAILLQTW